MPPKYPAQTFVNKSWLTPMDHTTSATPNRAVTKLDTECDRQATVVSRLLTTLGDDRRAVAKLFLIQRLWKSCRENYAFELYYTSPYRMASALLSPGTGRLYCSAANSVEAPRRQPHNRNGRVHECIDCLLYTMTDDGAWFHVISLWITHLPFVGVKCVEPSSL